MTSAQPIHGLWIDDSPRLVMTPQYLEEFRTLGFKTGAVMLETVTAGFDPKWTLKELELLGESFRKADVELVLTIWPEPRVQYLEQLEERLPAFLEASGAAALEVDTESNYTRKKLVGFKDMNAASTAVDALFDRLKHRFDVRTELTTFTMHAENSSYATLADDLDVTVNQGYSVRNRTDAEGRPMEVPWEHPFGPGRMQVTTFDRARTIPTKNGKPVIACGLAAYDQKWPGKTEEQAMDLAYRTALRYNPRECRWWSSKWVIGVRRQPWARQFFWNLAQQRR